MGKEVRVRALVTGASRGIGREIAIALARRGARVGIHCRRRHDEAEALRRELAASGHQVFRADLGERGEPEALVDRVAEAFGGLDLLVSNAGIFAEHPPLSISRELWAEVFRRTVEVNLLGPSMLARAALDHLGPGGRIVQVGSRGAFRGEPDAPAYGAAKAGLHAFGQSLAQAVAPRQIGVFTVAPGFVETEMASAHLEGSGGDAIRGQSPFGRVARPEEVAAMVAWCALDAPLFASGAILDCNGASYLRA